MDMSFAFYLNEVKSCQCMGGRGKPSTILIIFSRGVHVLKLLRWAGPCCWNQAWAPRATASSQSRRTQMPASVAAHAQTCSARCGTCSCSRVSFGVPVFRAVFVWPPLWLRPTCRAAPSVEYFWNFIFNYQINVSVKQIYWLRI